MKKATHLGPLLIALLACHVLAVRPTTAQVWEEWVATYNALSTDRASCLDLSAEGPVCVSGRSARSAGWDLVTILYNSNGVQQWVDRYDGPAQGDDAANDLIVDEVLADEYIYIYVTGFSEEFQKDFVTLKYNTSGQRLWIQRYDGPIHGNDEAMAMAAAGAGSICVTGYSEGSGTGADFLTIKYSQSGVQQWAARYDGGTDQQDEAKCLTVDNFGNIYVAGRSDNDTTGGVNFDGLLAKYNSAGILQWAARYDDSEHLYDEFAAIGHDQDGNIYVAGLTTGSSTGLDYLVVKYSPSGQQLWAATYNDSTDDDDILAALGVDQAANVFVTGYCEENWDPHCTTIKYSSNGSQLWVQSYPGVSGVESRGNALTVDYIGNVYVTGSYGDTDIGHALTLMYSPDGVQRWSIIYTPPGGWSSECYDIVPTGELDLIVTGYSYIPGNLDDYLTVKYSQSGPPTPVILSSFTGAPTTEGIELLWQTASEIACYGWQVQRGVNEQNYLDISPMIPGFGTTTDPHEYSFTDHTAQHGQTYTYRLKQIDLGGSVTYSDPITVVVPVYPLAFSLYPCSPNPFNTSTVLGFELPIASNTKLSVYDVFGREIARLVDGWQEAGRHSIVFEGANLPSGIYLCRLEAGEFQASGKMALMK